MKNSELVGKRFGYLTVIKQVESLNYRARFLCCCDCGNTKLVLGQSLLSGHVKSCGCYQSEEARKRMTNYLKSKGFNLHGQTRTRLYNIWSGIKNRCNSPNNRAYRNYGGRGIKICEEWENSFPAFYEWAIASGYSDNLTIDRINVDGDYCPENCRWASYSVQAENKRLLKRNTTGVTGVSFNRGTGKYVAYIQRNHKFRFLGSFDTLEEAKEARKNAEVSIAPT